MNSDFNGVHQQLVTLRDAYAAACGTDVESAWAPVTERDIVSDIHEALKPFCRSRGYTTHCEMKAVPDIDTGREISRAWPRIDACILTDADGQSWLHAAKTLQNQYVKGHIEARFSAVPAQYLHTAIEVKIQSDVSDARKDLEKLVRVRHLNGACNCFFVLFNARGSASAHASIRALGDSMGICVVEHTARA